MERLVRLLIVALSVGVILAACTSQTSTSLSPAAKTPAPTKGATPAGKTLTLTPVPANTTPAPLKATSTTMIKVTPMPTPASTPQPTASTAKTSPTAAAPANPVVVIKTSLGAIEVQLDPVKAPVTTRNFLSYVAKRHFDGTIFHRVIPDFMIQGGGFMADMTQKPTGAGIANESGNGLSNVRGTISMARTPAPDSATAQFFINVKDNASLDGRPGRPGYAVFGKVISGMDVVDKIRVVPTHSITAPTGQPMGDVPIQPVTIESISLKP